VWVKEGSIPAGAPQKVTGNIGLALALSEAIKQPGPLLVVAFATESV
jgi:hypothetical protein